MSKLFSARFLPLLITAFVFVALAGGAAAAYEGFLSPLSIANLFRNNAFLGILAVGMTFVILSGGIDLSVGTLLAFVTILLAKLIDSGWHPAAAIALALACGLAFGAGQGALIHCYRLPPFLVTLGGMFLAKGLAFAVHPQSLGISHDAFVTLARFRFTLGESAPVTTSTLVLLAVFAAALGIAHTTAFGRNVYAVGGSEPSAVLMGLPVGKTRIGVYALSGFCAATAGVVYTLTTRAGNPAIGLGMELDAIACTVIGGTLLTGGIGFVAGTLLGVLIYGTIDAILDFQGTLDSSWLRIAMGSLLMGFIIIQNTLTRVRRTSDTA